MNSTKNGKGREIYSCGHGLATIDHRIEDGETLRHRLGLSQDFIRQRMTIMLIWFVSVIVLLFFLFVLIIAFVLLDGYLLFCLFCLFVWIAV
jgi:hypothetical protein